MRLFLKIALFLIPFCSFGQLTSEQEEFINQEVFRLVNDFRINNNAQALKIDPDLEKAAKLQSDYNALKNKLSHLQSNPQYRTPLNRVSMVRTGDHKTVYSVGENANYVNIESDRTIDTLYLKEISFEIFDSWKQSKGHRENMLLKQFVFYGFSVTVQEESMSIYAIQVFTEKK